MTQLGQRLALDLPDPLTGQPELPADLVERAGWPSTRPKRIFTTAASRSVNMRRTSLSCSCMRPYDISSESGRPRPR